MKVTSSAVNHTATVVKELEEALKRGNAHASFEEAVKNIPHNLLGTVPEGLPYSIWQLAEHIRIAQWDMLEFSRDPNHKSPKWPDGYWPKEKAPAHGSDFKRSVEQTLADRKSFIELLHVADEGLYKSFVHGDGQSLLREALLIIDHTSYHTGEIIIVRRLLGNWES